MTLEVLVSAVNQQIRDLPERMHLESDAVIVNQTDLRLFLQSYIHG